MRLLQLERIFGSLVRDDALSLHAFLRCLGPLECVGGVGCFALADGGGLVRESLLVFFVVDAVVVLADESGRHVRDVLLWLCLLYTSDAADDLRCVVLGGRRIIYTKTC